MSYIKSNLVTIGNRELGRKMKLLSLSLYRVVIIISVLSVAFSISHIDNIKYNFIFLLPLSLLLISIFFYNLYDKYLYSIVFKLFIIQVCARYTLLPVLISWGQTFSIGAESSYLNIAIFVMILELMSAFIAFRFFSTKNIKNISKDELTISPLNNLVLLSIVLLLMFIYMYTSGSLSKVNFIWSLNSYIENSVAGTDELESSGVGILLFTPFKVLTALLFISLVYKSSKIKNNKKKWFYLIIILLSSLIIVGTSRLSIVFFVLPLVILTSSLVQKSDYKKILNVTAIIMFIVLTVTTIAKFSIYDNEFSSSSILTASSVNAYFAGPGNIAVGYEAFEKVEGFDSILYFINDVFQNVPLLSKLTLDEYKTTAKFNEEIYHHREYADQIVPLSISGLFHFGYIGVFIYSTFFLIVALHIEKISYRVSFIGYKYILISLSMTLSLIFMLNIGSFFASFSRVFLFLFIPLFLIERYSRMKNNLTRNN